jgi:RNA recognition motif-containing protein
MNESKIQEGAEDSKTIFVKNLPYDTTEQEVNDYFLRCGAIQGVRLVYNSLHNHFKGFGYVDFKNSSAVKEAVKLDGKIFKGRALTVDIETSKPKEGFKYRGTDENKKFYKAYM